MTEKLCVFCKHFVLDMGEPGYSEMTPGSDASIYCEKDIWEMSNYGDTNEYRRFIQYAKICQQYEPVGD